MRTIPAAVLAATSVVSAQVVGARFSPAPNHPRTAAWYARLNKPGFTPPGPVFGIVWTALDALLGYAGVRLLTAPRSPRRTAALAAWATNIGGVAGFSYVLFGRRRTGEALGFTASMIATSATAVATASRVDRRAARATAPLLAWVIFATAIQEEVWRRND